ncbi:MAG: EAL domain-containing protein [Treponemataceae bacterium]|nr:EAL domain-containing protein [Treponemataceae bacterium]
MYNSLGEICILILSAVLLFNTLFSFSLKERKNLLFLLCVLCTLLSCLADIISIYRIEHFDAQSIPVSTAITSLFFLFLGLTPFVFVSYVFEFLSISWKLKKAFYVALFAPIFVYLIVFALNFKFNLIFCYDPILGYTRGALKNITYVETMFYSMLILITVFCNRKTLSRHIKLTFVIYPILGLGISLIQFFSTYWVMTGTVSFATLLLVYLSVQTDLLEYDMNTGLLTEQNLEKALRKNPEGSLCVISIENYFTLQDRMSVYEFNALMINLYSSLKSFFGRSAYQIGANKVAIFSNNFSAQKKYVAEFFERFETVSTLDNVSHRIDFLATFLELPQNAKDYESAMELINNLLVSARKSKGRKFIYCDQTHVDEMNRAKKICAILDRELNFESKQFQVYFQPIYSVDEKRFVCAEALARLVGTEIGDIMPAEFIPFAESKGFVERLGKLVFEKVCDFIARSGNVVEFVSVNFSVEQMVSPNVAEFVLSTIERFGIEPRRIAIEITESVFMKDSDLIRRNMLRILGEGMKFSLDDFGAGYSNFANVISLPFQTIKIDRSFVLMMDKKTEIQGFVKNLVRAFKENYLTVLVKGVENDEQDKIVKGVGADYIQGFLYSRPVPEQEFLSVLKNGTGSPTSLPPN